MRIPMLISAVLYVVGVVPALWLSFDSFRWWFAAPLALLLLAALTSGPSIRVAERHGPLSDEELAQGARRARLSGVVVAVLLPIGGAVAGYLIDGVRAAIFCGALMAMGAVAGLIAVRRLHHSDS